MISILLLGRRRQDSGFIASSNESIIPFPEVYQKAPRKSPSMPNLSIRHNLSDGVTAYEDVFENNPCALKMVDSQKNEMHAGREKSTPKNLCRKHRPENVMVSVGTNTEDLSKEILDLDAHKNNTNEPIENISPNSQPIETVVIEKKSFNCTGLDFGIGGI